MNELGENGGLGREVDSKGQRVGSAYHVKDSFPEGGLHEKLLLGKHSPVVNSHPFEKGRLYFLHFQDGGKFVQAGPFILCDVFSVF